MQWDEDHYPDPASLVRQLHALNTRLMVSLWSRIDAHCDFGRELTEKNLYIPGTDWVDFLNPEARAVYWKNFSSRMLSLGIDAWWLDGTEPENDALKGTITFAGPGDRFRLLYPLLVNQTVYEGQRRDAPEKRVMILTRCAFLGQQRCASATWSGDVGNDWDTLRRQVTAGLNYSVSGLPYWTTDTGGFFRPGDSQYTDEAYHERYLRWLQFSVFTPLMRVHGYQTQTEPWHYGDSVVSAQRTLLELRYRLLPYIYSQAAEITFKGSTLMRPLVMDFPHDVPALNQNFEFMFGPAFLVAPVLAPGVDKWNVYAPLSNGGWYDWWTEEKIAAGSTVVVDAPLSRIPLLVRSGSIIPLGPVIQHTGQHRLSDLEIRIYPGADASFDIYEDDGTSYTYEQGDHSSIPLRWEDDSRTVEVGERKGHFSEVEHEQSFSIRIAGGQEVRTITYSGHQVVVKLA